MKSEAIKELFEEFEAAVVSFDTVECWSARDLQQLFDYANWPDFEAVIEKAKVAYASVTTEPIDALFCNVTRMQEDGTEKPDVLLTREACYLVAQNGDSKLEKIAFAQCCFAIQTRKAELVEQRLLDFERIQVREKLSRTESQLSDLLFERGVDNQGFGVVRSKGDNALFGSPTRILKWKMGIPNNRPLADFLPTISIKAKDLAAEMTGFNVQTKNLFGQYSIEDEHIGNNTAVRRMLVDRGIVPESLPPAEDVKKIQRKFKSDERRVLRAAKGFDLAE